MITAAMPSFFPPFLTQSNYFWKATFFLWLLACFCQALFSFVRCHNVKIRHTSMLPQNCENCFRMPRPSDCFVKFVVVNLLNVLSVILRVHNINKSVKYQIIYICLSFTGSCIYIERTTAYCVRVIYFFT